MPCHRDRLRDGYAYLSGKDCQPVTASAVVNRALYEKIFKTDHDSRSPKTWLVPFLSLIPTTHRTYPSPVIRELLNPIIRLSGRLAPQKRCVDFYDFSSETAVGTVIDDCERILFW